MRSFKFSRGGSLFFGIGILMSSLAQAGGEPCGGDYEDFDCYHRDTLLSGIHVAQPQVGSGVRFGEGGAEGAIQFGIHGASLDLTIGDVRAIPFEMLYSPSEGGFRIRVALLDSEVLFFCKDALTGETVLPGATLFKVCEEEGTMGVGGSLIDFQKDLNTGRTVAEWAQLKAVLNLLNNANNYSYLHERLNLFLGAGVQTVWGGHSPGFQETQGGSLVRMNMGITGMLRSVDNRWELRGMAGYRPNVVDFSDFGIQTKAEVLYHLLFDEKRLGTFGLEGRYDYWSVPGRSMGITASDQDRSTAYIGALFRLTLQ